MMDSARVRTRSRRLLRNISSGLVQKPLLFVDFGLSFGSANFRKERLGRGWNRHSAQ